MKKAMYAFSGDPITYGHVDIIERAARVFDEVTVGIGVNPDKKYMFDLEERTEMVERSLVDVSNAKVVPFRGLLVDYAYENNIDVIVKGVRHSTDFEYENILHQVGESQEVGIDTHILFARPKLAHISSGVVKGIQKENGAINEYVPLYVKQCLEARMMSQYIIGITGEIGAGKSYVSEQFVEIGKRKGIEVHNIELDHIGHQILGGLKESRYDDVRKQIMDTFGEQVGRADGTIDRGSLGEIVFSEKGALDALNDIIETPLSVRIRRELYGKQGLILFNAALIAESDMTHLCNNNSVLVYADKATQEYRLNSRGLSVDEIRRRLSSQFGFEEKRSGLERAIDRDNQGKIWTLDNSEGVDEIEETFDEVVSGLGVR